MSNIKNCTTCEKAIFCLSWGEYKCKARKIHIDSDNNECALCGLYKKGKPSTECHCNVCEERSKDD